MSLRHWEAVRDAIDESLRDCDDIATNVPREALARQLATVAIEAYDRSVYGRVRQIDREHWLAP